MKRRVFTDATLDALREIADPKLDALPVGDAASYFRVVAEKGLDEALRKWPDKDAVMTAVEEDTAEAMDALRAYVVDPAVAITRARELFSYFGDEICGTLLLAGLPDAYACDWGARVLTAHGDLVWALPRRVRETAMFMMAVFATDQTVGAAADPDGTAMIIRTSAGLRLFHHMVRRQLQGADVRKAIGPKNAPPNSPINQEDLLGTLLTFTVTTFRVLDRFAVHWTDDDREAYLLSWDLVGAALGIGTSKVNEKLKGVGAPSPIRPRTVDTANQVLDQLHERQWVPVQKTIADGRPFPWSGLAPGRMLANALLDALTTTMPATKRTWPAVVMRELAPPIVLSRLGLNGSGANSYATQWFAKRSPFANVGRSATLRMMANDITRHAMQSFLSSDGPPFDIPGFDLRELTARADVRPNLLELK